jgi:hypothetical protein
MSRQVARLNQMLNGMRANATATADTADVAVLKELRMQLLDLDDFWFIQIGPRCFRSFTPRRPAGLPL